MKIKYFGKVIALFCAASILLSTSVLASAASYETEDNGLFDSADRISVNATITGNIRSYNDHDCFVFTTTSNGYITISFAHQYVDSQETWSIRLYDSDIEQIKHMTFQGDESDATSSKYGLAAGTYYIEIACSADSLFGINYNLKVNFTQTNSWETESNNSFSSANRISLNNPISGNSLYCYNDSFDYYKFTTSANGYITINFVHPYIDSQEEWSIRLYDSNGDQIRIMLTPKGDEGNVTSYKVGLAIGTYYVRIFCAADSLLGIDYNLKVNFIQTNAWETENNNSFSSANRISLNNPVFGNGLYCYGDSFDYYKFTISATGYVAINFVHSYVDSPEEWSIRLFDSNGNQINKTLSSMGDETNLSSSAFRLMAGTYYIRVFCYADSLCGIVYTLTINTPTKPAAPSNLKAVSCSYNSIKLTWNSVSGAAGYAIYRYSASNQRYERIKTTTATTYINTSLSTGRTYYYKVFAYKTVGTNIYSGSSATVSAKPIPAIPTDFKATRYSSTSIKLTWNPVTGASGYVLYKYNTSTQAWDRLRVQTATSYINTGLTNGVTYSYKVRAYRMMNSSPVYGNPSAAISAKTY